MKKTTDFIKRIIKHVWMMMKVMIMIMTGKFKKMLGSSIEDMTANARHITLDELDELIPDEEV